MIEKTITYEDYDGNERTDTFYFNISRAEYIEDDMRTPGGMIAMINKITKEKNNKELVAIFRKFVLGSVGEKSVDGRRFIKNQEIRDSFEQSEAYGELIVELITNAEYAAAFMKGIFPKVKEDSKQISFPTNN